MRYILYMDICEVVSSSSYYPHKNKLGDIFKEWGWGREVRKRENEWGLIVDRYRWMGWVSGRKMTHFDNSSSNGNSRGDYKKMEQNMKEWVFLWWGRRMTNDISSLLSASSYSCLSIGDKIYGWLKRWVLFFFIV